MVKLAARTVRDIALVASLAAASAASGQLMVPDSTNDRIMLFSAVDGSLIDADWITDATAVGWGFSTPQAAEVVGGEIWVSDQLEDAIMRFDLNRNFLGLITTGAGGLTLDNVRGMSTNGTNVLLAMDGSGAAANTIAIFNIDGTDAGFFSAAGSFDAEFYQSGILVGSTDNDAVERYDSAGTFLGDFASGLGFIEQVVVLPDDSVIAVNGIDSAGVEGVHHFNADGTLRAFIDTNAAGLSVVRGAAVLNNGNYFISDSTGIYTAQPDGLGGFIITLVHDDANGFQVGVLAPPLDDDLRVSISESADPVSPVESLTYTVHVTNGGETTLTNVNVATTLSGLVQFTSSSLGTHDMASSGGVHTASFASMAPTTTESYTIAVAPQAIGTATTTVTGSAAQADPDLANNTASAETEINNLADLLLTIEDFPDPVTAANGAFSYSVQVANFGPEDATNVAVVLDLDAQTMFSSTSVGTHDGSLNGGTVTANLGTIPSGSSGFLDVVVLAGGANGTSYVATATASSDQADPTPLDGAASATTMLSIPPANDDCSSAVTIALFGPQIGTTVGASESTTATCGFDENDVWYQFVPDPNQAYRFTTTFFDTSGSIAAFDACFGAELACDTGTTSTPAMVDVAADSAGSPIFLRVASNVTDATGFEIIADIDPDPAPMNDLCSRATVVDLTTPFFDSPDTSEAENEGDLAGSCDPFSASTTDNSVFYTFTPATDMLVRVSVQPTGYDAVVAAFTGSCGAFFEEACTDEGGGSGAAEELIFQAFAGLTYFVSIGDTGSGDGGGPTTVNIEQQPPAADIFVELRASTGVTVGAGGDLKYVLDLTNNGPSDGTDVAWSVTLPNEVEYITSLFGTHDGSTAGGIVSGTAPFIAVDTTERIVITTAVLALGPGGTGFATSSGGTPIDDDLSNNSSTSRSFIVVESADPYGTLVLGDDFIDQNFGPEPKSLAPGLGGRLISGFDKPFISPDGTKYIINVDLADDTLTDETLVVFDGATHSTVAQETTTLLPDVFDLVDAIDQKLAINNAGEYVFQTNTDGIDISDETIVKGDGVSHTVIAREGNPFPDGASFLYGSTLESPSLTNAGDVYFWGDTDNGATDEYFVTTSDNGLSVTPLIQEGVFVPGNQVNGGMEVLGDVDLNDLWVTGDGAHYLLQGDLDGGTTNDDVVIYDGNIVIQENVQVHPDIGDTADSGVATDAIFLAHNGDWYARGSNNNGTHWVVKNGAPIAMSGQPIYPGATENWRTDTAATFFFVVADHRGNYVVGGFTDSLDERSDVVLVLNGERVISREFDPIDLDSNGLFDDSPFNGGGAVFIHTYGNDDGIITDDGHLLVTVDTRTILVDLTGDAYISIDLGLEAGCVCETDNDANQVDVFDLLAYLDLWFVNDAGADIDGAAGVDVFDLLFFLDCWFPASAGAPCP